MVADGGMRLAAEAVRVRLGGRVLLCQHQLVVFVLDLTRFVVAEEFSAVIRTHIFGNDAVVDPLLLGHADACAVGQTVLANGDVGAPIQIHIAGSISHSIFHCVPRDGRRTGHGEGGALSDTHTVAGVALDAGVAVHVEGAALADIHAAAVCRLVVADTRCLAVHVEGAVAADIHAAAVGGVLRFAVRRRVAADAGGVVHFECAAVHIHAAAIALVRRVVGRRVARDAGAVVHFEGAALADIHAAAVVCRRVAADGAAVHDEGAAVRGEGAARTVHTHAAAVGRRVAADGAAVHGEGGGGGGGVHTHAAVSGGRRIAGDAGVVVHGECAVHHIHAAAGAVVPVGRSVAGDAGVAVHGEGAAADIHATAALGRRVVGDGAAVHVEFAVRAGHTHAAASLRRRVAGDGAAIHIKGAAAFHFHTAAGAVAGVLDLAHIAFAIRQGQRAVGFNQKHGLIFGAAFERLAVQADGDVASDHNSAVDLNFTVFCIIFNTSP